MVENISRSDLYGTNGTMLKDIIEAQEAKARLYHPEHLGVEGGSCVACALIDLQSQTAQIVAREVRRKERAYWVNVFDSAPVREKKHPYDIVARNLARIEVDRLDKALQSLEEELSEILSK